MQFIYAQQIGLDALRTFLPLYLLSYLAAAFFWRSFVVWKRTGINPVVFKSSDNANDFVGQIFKILFAAVVLVVLTYSFSTPAYQYLNPFPRLEVKWIKFTGIALLLLSLLWTLVTQAQTGDSWRIGIDAEHHTKLVSRGVYRVSRNPIFLGMMITLFGLLLVIPNTVTLVAFVMGIVLINIQVRLEEEHLSKVHGVEYEDYRRRVRRWI